MGTHFCRLISRPGLFGRWARRVVIYRRTSRPGSFLSTICHFPSYCVGTLHEPRNTCLSLCAGQASLEDGFDAALDWQTQGEPHLPSDRAASGQGLPGVGLRGTSAWITKRDRSKY